MATETYTPGYGRMITQRIDHVTSVEYSKKIADQSKVRTRILDAHEKHGRTEKNKSLAPWSDSFEAGMSSPRPYVDLGTKSAEREGFTFFADFTMASYYMQQIVTMKEKMQNEGPGQIARIVDRFYANQDRSFRRWLNRSLFLDTGEFSTNADEKVYGLFDIAGKTEDSPTGKYFLPEAGDTYGGKSMALGGITGRLRSGTYGEDGADYDPGYDAWTPFGVNYAHADFGDGTWGGACEKATRLTLPVFKENRADHGDIDNVFVTPSMHAEYLFSLQDKERHVVFPNKGNSVAVDVGYEDVLRVHGVDFVADADVPADMGVGFKWEDVTLRLAKGDKFQRKAFYDDHSEAEYYEQWFHGQWQLNPRSVYWLGTPAAIAALDARRI